MEKLTIRDAVRACPFCGSTADLIAVQEPGIEARKASCVRFNNKVGCRRCDIYFRRYSIYKFTDGHPECIKDGFAEAVEAWNKRAN